MASLRDHIMRARQAQQDNAQKHDVQLSAIPFVEPETFWASEAEYRDAWHGIPVSIGRGKSASRNTTITGGEIRYDASLPDLRARSVTKAKRKGGDPK
jgi:hypothetical protein